MIYLIDKTTKQIVGSVNGMPSLSDLATRGLQAVESSLTVAPHKAKVVESDDALEIVERPYIELATHTNGLEITITATVREPTGAAMIKAEGEVLFWVQARNDTTKAFMPGALAYGKAKTSYKLDEPGSYFIGAEHPDYVMQVVPIYVSEEVN